MNEKTAKKIRRTVRQFTNNIPTIYQQHPLTGALYCVPTCTRAIYKAMKKLNK